MAKRKTPLVPEARDGLDQLKAKLLKQKGYTVTSPDKMKFEMAKSLGIPLRDKGNATLSSHDAGKIGGHMGGSMVQELVCRAKKKLENK